MWYNKMPIREISETLKAKAKAELNEDPARINDDIEYIKEWLHKEPHLNGRNDEQFLVAFLRGSKFSLERTKEKLDMYFTLRTLLPEFFKDRDPLRPEIQTILNAGVFIPLDNVNDAKVTIIRNGIFKADDIVTVFKTQMMLADIGLMEDDDALINGVIIVQDMAGVTLAHAANAPVTRKALKCFQDAYPARIKGLHFINVPPFFETGFNMVKPFLSDKIKNRVHVHGTIDSLYPYVPLDILPKEYGGQGSTIHQITELLKRKVESYRVWFLDDQKYGSNESKRIGGQAKSASDLFGLEGSFRKLQVD